MMTKEVGTLREIGAQDGDVVSFGWGDLMVTRIDCDGNYFVIDEDGKVRGPVGNANPWRIVHRAKPQPKLWRDMTPEEKGDLVLAAHEWKVIQSNHTHEYNAGDWNDCDPEWCQDAAYRIKPDPKVETVNLTGANFGKGLYTSWSMRQNGHIARETHRITFQTIDGVPDCASIKMEEL